MSARAGTGLAHSVWPWLGPRDSPSSFTGRGGQPSKHLPLFLLSLPTPCCLINDLSGFSLYNTTLGVVGNRGEQTIHICLRLFGPTKEGRKEHQ